MYLIILEIINGKESFGKGSHNGKTIISIDYVYVAIHHIMIIVH